MLLCSGLISTMIESWPMSPASSLLPPFKQPPTNMNNIVKCMLKKGLITGIFLLKLSMEPQHDDKFVDGVTQVFRIHFHMKSLLFYSCFQCRIYLFLLNPVTHSACGFGFIYKPKINERIYK